MDFTFFLCLCLILTSGFLSGSEIALFSLSRYQLRQIRDKFPKLYRKIKTLMLDPVGLLSSILVTNEVINVALSSLLANILAKRWARGGGLIPVSWFSPETPELFIQGLESVLVTAPIFLLLCELTPKAIGANFSSILAPIVVTPIFALYRLASPGRRAVRRLFQFIQRFFTGVKKPALHTHSHVIREDDFMAIVEEARREGSLDKKEVNLIENVLELNDTVVSEIFVPISKVVSLPENSTIEQAFQFLRNRSYSRIPITGKQKEIIGVLYKKDLIFSQLHSRSKLDTIDTLIRKPYFVSLDTKLSTLFRTLRSEKNHIAIVIGPSKDPIGIITMRDILYEIFEELFEKGATP